MTLRPGSTTRPLRSARSRNGGSSRSNAASGSAIRRVCTARARPLSSTQASAASAARRVRGRSRRNVARPCGGRGEMIRRRVELQRSLPYWPKQVQLLAVLADGVADLLEPTEVEGLPRGPAGDHRDRGDHVGEVDQHLGGIGVDVRLLRVVHDRGEGAVEVEADDRAARGAHERGVLLLPLGRGELHVPTLSSGSSGSCRAGRHRAGSGAAQDSGAVRISVSRSIRIGSTAGAVRLMPRSSASCFAAGLSLAGSRRCWPGWCRTSCRSRRPASRCRRPGRPRGRRGR